MTGESITRIRCDKPIPLIPRYRHIRTLGEGTTADVHHFRQNSTGMDVAVKVIRKPLDEGTRERFDAETHLMARVSDHPFILTMVDAGTTTDDRGYIILEYAPEGSCKQAIHRHPLGVEQALDFGISIAGALETAHRAGIIHRDIKPANILVTRIGLPALSDFGISTTIRDSRQQTGFSLPWAPPEVIERRENTERSDIYSLAATVFAAIAAESPYEYAYHPRNSAELETLILSRDAPSLTGPTIPAGVSRTLAIAMARSPQDRYPTALAFARALQTVQMSCFGHMSPLIVKDEPRYPQNREHGHASPPVRMVHDQKTEHRGHTAASVVAATTAIAVALCLTVALMIWPPRDSAGGMSTTVVDDGTPGTSVPRTMEGTESQPQTVPSPTNLVGRYSGDTVTFTWTNPAPSRGDTYAWAKVGTNHPPESIGTAIVDTTSVSITEVNEDQLCIRVSIVRSDRRMSQHPTTSCAVRR